MEPLCAHLVVAAKWQQFFLEAGIPRKIAVQYSHLFVEQRISETMLEEIDKSTLVDLGITTIGDQVSFQSSKPTRTRLAPDRDDIYHVRLPAGTTPRTRAIMAKHNLMKSAGTQKVTISLT
uniref:SAM domain-containing protein n=1 Tax=Parascaris equorum TaxID=6256 RepID=A0A914RZX1_PAREQ